MWAAGLALRRSKRRRGWRRPAGLSASTSPLQCSSPPGSGSLPNGVDNVELLHADAQAYAFETESFDVVISRFGMMFFEDPQAAFANLARALRSGGRLVFVCPQDPLKSEWVAVAFGAAVAALAAPPISALRALQARSRSPTVID